MTPSLSMLSIGNGSLFPGSKGGVCLMRPFSSTCSRLGGSEGGRLIFISMF